jgi:hypothetical protein
MVQQILPIHDLVRVSHEVFQKSEFLQGQLYGSATFGHTPCPEVELNIADRELFRKRLRGSPQEGLNARNEFGK